MSLDASRKWSLLAVGAACGLLAVPFLCDGLVTLELASIPPERLNILSDLDQDCFQIIISSPLFKNSEFRSIYFPVIGRNERKVYPRNEGDFRGQVRVTVSASDSERVNSIFMHSLGCDTESGCGAERLTVGKASRCQDINSHDPDL
jgi:hypothetical protein